MSGPCTMRKITLLAYFMAIGPQTMNRGSNPALEYAGLVFIYICEKGPHSIAHAGFEFVANLLSQLPSPSSSPT